MITKITARFVIGFDGHDHIIYQDGEVLYQNERILRVGPASDAPADRLIDAGNAIVSPGFVDLDALWDIDHCIFDSFQNPEQSKGLEWSEKYFYTPRSPLFSADEERFRRKYAMVQLILNGVTTALPISGEYHKLWAETYDEFVAITGLCGELGLRAYLGPSYRSGVTVTDKDGQVNVLWDFAKGEQGLADAVRFVKDFDGAHGGLVRGFLAPARIQSCTPDLLRQTKAASLELDCPVRLHACQEDNEIYLMRKHYGKTPLSWLHEIGFLGERLMIPHATHIQGRHKSMPGADELHLLSDNGVSVVHCPLVEARYGAALDSFEKYRRAGVNIGLGTDTFPPDMIRVMDFGLNLSKVMEGNQWTSKAADFYRAATLWGAKALGRDDLGRLAPGSLADIIIIRLDQIQNGPVEDPIRTLLLHSSGRQVQTVIINGRTVMEDYHIPGVDLEQMRRDGQAYFDKMMSGYTQRDFKNRSKQELFPPEIPFA